MYEEGITVLFKEPLSVNSVIALLTLKQGNLAVHYSNCLAFWNAVGSLQWKLYFNIYNLVYFGEFQNVSIYRNPCLTLERLETLSTCV